MFYIRGCDRTSFCVINPDEVKLEELIFLTNRKLAVATRRVLPSA